MAMQGSPGGGCSGFGVALVFVPRCPPPCGLVWRGLGPDGTRTHPAGKGILLAIFGRDLRRSSYLALEALFPPLRVNMISAANGQGKVRFMLYQNTINQQRLIRFKVFLILDNLKVHHSKLAMS